MATSLSKIKSQIEKLQKQAASIQSTVISRIKREIAQHGLGIEDLFGSSGDKAVASVGPSESEKTLKLKKSSSNRPAKFSDGKGNTWHGMGIRPQWIHDALSAGRKLDEFLIAGKKGSPASETAPKASVKKTRAKKAQRVTQAKGAATRKTPAKKVLAKTEQAEKVAKKLLAAKSATGASAGKRKAVKSVSAAKPVGKATSRKTARVKLAPTSTTEGPVGQLTP